MSEGTRSPPQLPVDTSPDITVSTFVDQNQKPFMLCIQKRKSERMVFTELCQKILWIRLL